MPNVSLRYFWSNWTGRIIALNVVIFLIISLQAGSILSPKDSMLFAFGSKDSINLALGQYWRFITPIFIHIGIIHLVVNNYSLLVIGQNLEQIFGAKLYLFLYLFAGISGNIASACFNIHPSAGASGALFGLLGAGFTLELFSYWSHQRSRERQLTAIKSYAFGIFFNLLIGVLIPQIDNAAHIGGLISGCFLTAIFLCLFPNRVAKRRLFYGIFLVSTYVGLFVIGVVCGSSVSYTKYRFEQEAVHTDDYQQKLYYQEFPPYNLLTC